MGLVLANLLGSAGVPVVVYERDRAPSALPRAVHLDDEALRVLQTAGLDRLDGARPSPGMELVDGGGRVFWRVHRSVAHQPQGHPLSVLVHQPALEDALRRGLERFDHVQLRQGWEVIATEVEPDADGRGADDGVELVAMAADGRRVTEQVGFLVGCDGAASGLRRRFGGGLRGSRFEQRWLVLDAREPPPMGTSAMAQQICDPARPATYVPVGGPDGRRCRWEFLVHPGEDAATLCTAQGLSALLAPWPGSGAAPEVERLAVYRFHAVRARRWRTAGVLLAGDAAHQMPPFLGQGLCAGIRDAGNLAWKLRLVHQGLACEAILDTYQREREPHVRMVTALSTLLGRVVHGEDPVGRLLRGLLRAAAILPAPLRRVAQQPVMPGLPDSSLADRGSVASRLAQLAAGAGVVGRVVGRPIPQPKVRCAGREVLLDEALGDGFGLVALGSPPPLEDATARWFAQLGRVLVVGDRQAGDEPTRAAVGVEDITGALMAWFRHHRVAVALVRPDRYVFAASRSPQRVQRALLDLRAVLEGAA